MTYDDWKARDDTPEPESDEFCDCGSPMCLCPGCHTEDLCVCGGEDE
jgi:hypothetical protein